MIDKILYVYISVWATFGVTCISAKPTSIWKFSEKSDNFVFFLPSNLLESAEKILIIQFVFTAVQLGSIISPGEDSISVLTDRGYGPLGLWTARCSDFTGSWKTINHLQKWSHLCFRIVVGFLKLLCFKTLSKNYSHFYIFLILKVLLTGIRDKCVSQQFSNFHP